jgi:hypothetical protein
MLTLVFAQEISMDRLETGGPVQLQNTPIAHISFEQPIKLMEDDNFSSKPKSKDTYSLLVPEDLKFEKQRRSISEQVNNTSLQQLGLYRDLCVCSVTITNTYSSQKN